MPANRISSGVMSDPPPIPVMPMRIPTPRPKTMTRGSTPGQLSDHVDAALGLVGPGPAARASAAGLGARRAADRRIALVVQRVVGQLAFEDPVPDVLLGPERERVVLLDPGALGVVLDQLGGRARVGLLAADAGDPRVRAGQRALQRRDLQRRA